MKELIKENGEKICIGDWVTCVIEHDECKSKTGPCLRNVRPEVKNGVAVVERLIAPDSVYLQAINGDSIGTRGLEEMAKVVLVREHDLKNLIYKADEAALCLKEEMPGKSEFLVHTYMKIADQIGMKS